MHTSSYTPPMPPHLSPDHVRKIARLARLELNDGEVERYRHDLSAVLGYMDRLRGLDLAGVEPMTGVPGTAEGGGLGGGVNRLDADAEGETIPTEVLLRMAPATDGAFVRVPRVLDEGGA